MESKEAMQITRRDIENHRNIYDKSSTAEALTIVLDMAEKWAVEHAPHTGRSAEDILREYYEKEATEWWSTVSYEDRFNWMERFGIIRKITIQDVIDIYDKAQEEISKDVDKNA